MNDVTIISWNLLRLVGASTSDVAELIDQYQPDLLLMQEATKDVMALPTMIGGQIFRQPLQGRVYGLAAWSRFSLAPPEVLPLPVSTMPGRVPPRLAQIVKLAGVSVANVHLSHGQFLNRWQLLHLVRSLNGHAAIVGDYNAVGPIKLAGLRDVGPREPTHVAGRLIPVRLDRCMVRGLTCLDAKVLERGSSDHCPIMVRLSLATEISHPSRRNAGDLAASPHGPPQVNLRHWLRVLAGSEVRAAVPLPGAEDGMAHRNGQDRQGGRPKVLPGIFPHSAGAASSAEPER